MSGLDDVFQNMNAFQKNLVRFNDELKQSMRDVMSSHDKVAPLWKDSLRKMYDSQWNSYEEAMKRYTSKDGQNYVDNLQKKLNALKGYLYGA